MKRKRTVGAVKKAIEEMAVDSCQWSVVSFQLSESSEVSEETVSKGQSRGIIRQDEALRMLKFLNVEKSFNAFRAPHTGLAADSCFEVFSSASRFEARH